ncbi:pirin family protein [Parachryseolinea silvisoli]|uniref:pirin family protein n=1 Tax=Parachryseolinea silvisoli TaxID=2873601 RepID=UPI00226582F6|nr:pirin family protein [Parachryseolinea silvisoli]MCD9017686.1 pirin family protein [Parachryseolinea silvisoli]
MRRSVDQILSKPAFPGMIGDGFRVYNVIPGYGVTQERVSPFLMMDYNPAHDFGPSDVARGVAPHPHKGFEAVTIAYKGSLAHSDSAGNEGIIRAGDVQWMTAGSGVLHKEYHEAHFSQRGGALEIVQLWVNLPRRFKYVPPAYKIFANKDFGSVKLDNGGVINVIAGDFAGTVGPARTFTPLNIFDIKLDAGGFASVPIPANHNCVLFVISGTAVVNDVPVAEHSLLLFKNDGTHVDIAVSVPAVLLLLSGAPIPEPIVSYGPFVMNSDEEIRQAIVDFQAGKFGKLQ